MRSREPYKSRKRVGESKPVRSVDSSPLNDGLIRIAAVEHVRMLEHHAIRHIAVLGEPDEDLAAACEHGGAEHRFLIIPRHAGAWNRMFDLRRQYVLKVLSNPVRNAFSHGDMRDMKSA